MRTGRFTTLLLVALFVLSSQLHPASATPADSTVGRALTTDRRIVVTNQPPFVYGFGSQLHVPGLACEIFPAELNLQDLTFERGTNGYVGTAIFFNPLSLLSELNGNSVSFAVSLVLAPPKGSKITVRASLTTGNVTVKQGKKTLDPNEAQIGAFLNVDRLVFALPDTLGIAPDWDVWAQVSLSAKQSWCELLPPGLTSYTATTPPATVGSLTGEDPTGIITAPATVDNGTLTAKSSAMPNGAKVKALSFETDPDGSLVAVVTMRGDVAALAKSAKDPSNALFVDLDLADPSFFGLKFPYTLSWSYFPKANPEPTARVEDPYLGAAAILGEVPVTIDGARILFHLGKFTKIDYPVVESTSLPIPVGDFRSVFFGTEPASDPVCVCPPDEAPDTTSDADPYLEYDIIGNLITIKHLASGETAYGWIDHRGYFLAQNDHELYRGAIGFYPTGDTYEVGVQAIHALISETQSEASGSRPTTIAFTTSLPAGSLRAMPRNQDVEYNLLRYVKTTLERISETDVYDCEHLHDVTFEDKTYQKRLEEECERIKKAIVIGRTLLLSSLSDPELNAAYQQALNGTVGMTNPPSPVIANLGIPFSAPATPVAVPAMPFPLPFTIATPFEPQSTNPDWAIRVTSSWQYVPDPGEQGEAVISTPFVDSHLLLGGTEAALSALRAPALTLVDTATLSDPTRPRRVSRRHLRPRRRRHC